VVAQRTTPKGWDLSVDRDYDLPLGVQLGWKLRALIASGRIGAGERLPSVRELAERAGVNVNTVRTVYGRLASDGFISSRHGRGTFAADPPPSAADVERLAAAAVAEARAEGLDPRDLATAIYAAAEVPDPSSPESPELEEPNFPDDPPPGSPGALPDLDREADEPGSRRELRRQIEKLEGQLSAYPELAQAAPPEHSVKPKPHLPDFAELERSRNHLIDRLAELRAAAEMKAAEQERARGWVEDMVEDPSGHRWEMVSNGQIGEPGCKAWRSVPRFSFLGMLMGWWQVKVSSGCPLAGPLEAVING
jgi:DNA-binding transcriptional regulator YhcF (GntR family)